jgi:ferrochelatase
MIAKTPKTGALLVNLGTPDAPTPAAVRRYLAEFLWDPRVVEIPRPIWWLVLHGIVLRTRPGKSAKAYRAIWTERGSPLLYLTEALAQALREELAARGQDDIPVEIAMRYGRPSLPGGLKKLKEAGVEEILILPLYPQYSAATAASIFDKAAETLRAWRHLPSLRFVGDYHRNDGYIAAVAGSIAEFWRANEKAQLLLMSFHGLPERSRALGDPYYEQCVESARAIANRLGLAEKDWRLAFQSRFGPARWLQPYCAETLEALPAEGVKAVDVVCPGFAVDCLETLEEIAIANRKVFLAAGGESYRYIPALNASAEHARVLAGLISDDSREARPFAQ